MKGKPVSYKCGMCEVEDETQEHIYTCKSITQISSERNIKYEEINRSNANQQIQIARTIIEHMKIMKQTHTQKS